MLNKIENIVIHYEEIMNELNEPSVINDQNRFKKLMKEQSDLSPLIETYKEYKKNLKTISEGLELLESESDEEMRALLKEEISTSKSNVDKLEKELKILLLPKDLNDDKNVIMEIRSGAGGEEAAIFAYELFRMYVLYA